MLKTRNFIILTGVFILLSSQIIQNFSNPIQDYRLVGPNDAVLFANLKELKDEISRPISDKFKKNTDFKIKEITYTPNPYHHGVIADIKYVLPDGTVTNIILLKNIPTRHIMFGSKWDVKGTSSAELSKETKPIVKFSCSGSICCEVHSHISNDGTVSFDCTCNNCVMTVYND